MEPYNKINLESKIELTFEYFTQQISNYKNQDFIPSKKEIKEIQNFAILLKQRYFELSLGPDWFFKYFSFQFEYWRNKQSRYYKGLAKIGWIIGPKAFNRWLNKSGDYWYFCTQGVLSTNKNIKKSDIEYLFGKEKTNNIGNSIEIEEVEKNIYYNEDAGFVHCLRTTTLFNNQSKACQNCKFNKPCEQLLKNNYPKLYKKRNNEI